MEGKGGSIKSVMALSVNEGFEMLQLLELQLLPRFQKFSCASLFGTH